MSEPLNLILASGSAARSQMLKNAGLAFKTCPADLDEEEIQSKMSGQLPLKIVQELAKQKALFVSRQYPKALIIGADQILVFENKIFSKSNSVEEARKKLLAFKGKTHHLISAVSVCQNGEEIWSCDDEASLFMKNFENSFLEKYLKKAGDNLISCVGGYALESAGIQLFREITGDYFTILGLPLLPLLNFLDQRGVSL